MRAARAIMADLAATGMTPDQIALVMELSAAISAEARPVEDEAANRRRDRDREYQAQRRSERRQISADSADVVETPSLSLPPNEKISNPPTHTHPDTTPRARKGTRLPLDWQPEALEGDLANDVRAWSSGAIERELAKFRDWAKSAPGQKGIKSDWQATWRNWLRRKIDEGPRNGQSPSNDDIPANPMVRAVLASQAQRAAGIGGSDDCWP